MKYVVILGDGMADRPVPELGNKTPLQRAKKPNMDYLARNGEIGKVKTIPDGFSTGSDVANLSVLGYDPRLYHTGRSPLEAASMGINMGKSDMAFRCNLVNLSEDEPYENKRMIDYSSDEITTQESEQLIKEIDKHLGNDIIKYYPGISYRHCMIWKNSPEGFQLTPPHDITGRCISDYIPRGKDSELLLEMMKKSVDILKNHPVNIKRIERGLKPANSIWLWGQGRKPQLSSFYEKYSIKGSVISAVDLIKGIAACSGLKSIDVEGATGNIDTNYSGKAEAAIKELENGSDFVYIHIEAPDECGHRYEIDNKVKAIEMIDEFIIGPVLKHLSKYEDFKIMVLPDHATPLEIRTHSPEPVPYIIFQKTKAKDSGIQAYDEFNAEKTGIFIEEGHTLMDRFITKI